MLWGWKQTKLKSWLISTNLSSHDLIQSRNRYLYGVEMALCMMHHATPRTPCPILVEHRVTRKTIIRHQSPCQLCPPRSQWSIRVFKRLWVRTPATYSLLSGYAVTPSGTHLVADGNNGWWPISQRRTVCVALMWLIILTTKSVAPPLLVGPWFGHPVSPVGELQGLFKGPLRESGEHVRTLLVYHRMMTLN